MKNSKNAKSSELPMNAFDFEGLVSFEELDSYSFSQKNGKKFLKIGDEINQSKSTKKKKRRKENDNVLETKCVSTTKSTYENNKDNSSSKRKRDESELNLNKKLKSEQVDITAWKSIGVSGVILEAIKRLGFKEPTPIQKLTIPAALRGKADIVGAAETGSGKTLAFIIPIVNGILNERKKIASGAEPEEEDEDEDEEEELENMEQERNLERKETEDTGCVKVINNVKFDFLEKQDKQISKTKLQALVITPTRELAIQIKNHTDAILLKTDIKCAVLIGGLARQKQERVLSKGPEIVIGTPGRLWELIDHRNPHLSELSSLRYLAIDETDRMMEKGHFEELQQLLKLINDDEAAKKRRRNFIFSATLSLTHAQPKRIRNKKKVKEVTSGMKMETLMKMVGVGAQYKVVDITRKLGTAEMLSEAKIICDKEEKDIYLYYFLTRFPGRTLIFCNSINCVRRLDNLLKVLQYNPQTLHASKHQKQRLKSLERFTSDDMSVLLATDVAARGIDIPGVKHIIHYEVPRTAEMYIHRSGRTARANHEGVSVLFVNAEESGKYQQLRSTLNRSSDFPSFPIENDIWMAAKKRVVIARDIEFMQHSAKKKCDGDLWIKNLAKEAGMDSEEGSDDDETRAEFDMQKKSASRELENKMQQLSNLLSKPMISKMFSSRYPTSSGKLVLPNDILSSISTVGAIDVIKKKDPKKKPKFIKKKKFTSKNIKQSKTV